MDRFLVIGDRRRYGWMRDFVVLWIGEAGSPGDALQQLGEKYSSQEYEVYKVIRMKEETRISTYSGF